MPPLTTVIIGVGGTPWAINWMGNHSLVPYITLTIAAVVLYVIVNQCHRIQVGINGPIIADYCVGVSLAHPAIISCVGEIDDLSFPSVLTTYHARHVCLRLSAVFH